MAEDLVFARKASGLVRGLDMWDAFGAGLMTCQPIATLWLMVGIALSLYPTGNLLISIAIGAVTAGIGAPLVWGILSGSMPRAGGEYVYNSRILHPAIALGAVFCNIIAIFYWNWYIATWLGVPALQLLRPVHGLVGLRRLGRLQHGPRGPRPDRRRRRLRLGGLQHEELRADPEDHAHPRHRRRARADRRALPLEQGRLHPQLERDRRPVQVAAATSQFIQAAGPLPNTWNWRGTLGAFSGVYALFVYNYAIAYLSGEVKRPDKALLGGNILAVWVPIILGFLTALGLYRIMAFNFLSASAAQSFGAGVARLHGAVQPRLPDADLDRQRQERHRRLGHRARRSSPSSGWRSPSPS